MSFWEPTWISGYTCTDFNLFSTNVSLLDSLETSENLRFSDVLRGYRSGTLVENELINWLHVVYRKVALFSEREKSWKADMKGLSFY